MSNDHQASEQFPSSMPPESFENEISAPIAADQPTQNSPPSLPQVSEINADELPPDVLQEFFPPNEIVTPAPEPQNDRALPVFDPVALQELSRRNEFERSEYVAAMNPVIDAALRNLGRRVVPDFEFSELSSRLRSLASAMPNFTEIIDYLLYEIGYSGSGDVKEFRIEPLLIVGGPARHL